MAIIVRKSPLSYYVFTFAFLCMFLLYFHNKRLSRDDVLYGQLLDHYISHNITPSSWATREPKYPITLQQSLPRPMRGRLPPVQYDFAQETQVAAQVRQERQTVIKQAFQRCWQAYKAHAWLGDELLPVTAGSKSAFGGWAATLVDSLDTLWIMDMKEEFNEAVAATTTIDFTSSSSVTISLFETTIRFLGGLLSAYDLSNDPRLLWKAMELGEMLYAAFDTPNHLPRNWFHIHRAAEGDSGEANSNTLSAEIGSLSLEFTRLSQITHDPKWFDAINRITWIFDTQQHDTLVPGMWPLTVNAMEEDFKTGDAFTLGAMADSLYEYLPKMHALLGGSAQYMKMYRMAMDAAIEHVLFRPMVPDEADILVPGTALATSTGDIQLQARAQHLGCFTGGMLALGGRLSRNEMHVQLGRKVTDGCIWAYNHSLLGIMPEAFTMVACGDKSACPWDESRWKQSIAAAYNFPTVDVANVIEEVRLQPGFSYYDDRRYILRPEAIESVFVLYRVTGDPILMEQGWQMFESIDKHTRTEIANSAIEDVTMPEAPLANSMESFWLAETLKYFYLLYSPPDLISLDEYVFNTEAHPLRRPQRTFR